MEANVTIDFFAATALGRLDVVENLIRSESDVNETTNDGETPLYIASRGGTRR